MDLFKQTIKPPMVFSPKKRAAIMLALKGRREIPYSENDSDCFMSVEEGKKLFPEVIYASWIALQNNKKNKEAQIKMNEEINLLRDLG